MTKQQYKIIQNHHFNMMRIIVDKRIETFKNRRSKKKWLSSVNRQAILEEIKLCEKYLTWNYEDCVNIKQEETVKTFLKL